MTVLILDQRMRFVGDAAAIVAGTSEEAGQESHEAVKIKYEVLEPVLDFRQAKTTPFSSIRKTTGRVCVP